MKTHVSVIAVLALALCLVGCTADVDGYGSRDQMSLQKIQITATAADNAPETKTARIGQDFYWSPGDRISLFYGPGEYGGSEFTSTNTEYATRTIFEGMINIFTGLTEDSDAIKFWGIFPYDEGNSCVDGGASVITTIQANQETAHNSWGNTQSVCLGRSDGLAMSFYNLCGGIKFCISQEGINKITFAGNNDQTLAGQVKVSMDNDNHPVIDQFLGDAKEITLTTDGNFTPISGTDTTWYFLIVPPTTFENGFTFTFTKEDGQTATRTETASRTVRRNVFGVMRTPLDKDLEFASDEPISFSNDNFQAYCVEHFDTNGNGAVSQKEALAVTKIDVCTDEITSLGGIEYFLNLRELKATGSSVTTKGTKAAGSGQLQDLDVSANTKLEILDCRGNQITTLDVSNNPVLTVLECTENPQLETVSLAPDQVIPTLEIPVAANVVYEWVDEEETQTPDEIWYTTSDGNPVTLSSIASFGDVEIDSNTYEDGKGVLKFSGPVKTIGRGSFELSRLSSVTLPEGLTKLEAFAFSHCYDMVSITLPSTLTHIGEYAFTTCTKLTYFTLPDSVTEIEDAAFLNVTSVKSFQGPYASDDHKCLVIGGKLITIAPAGLTSFTVPSGVTSIGNYAFAYSSLQSVSLPSSIISIGERAFENCPLSSITLPENLTSIGAQAFFNCPNLTSITIPQSVTTMDGPIVTQCGSLQEFNGKFASDDHRCLVVNGRVVGFAPAGLTVYTIPSSVTSITWGAFTYCTTLKSITIPESVISIGETSFNK